MSREEQRVSAFLQAQRAAAPPDLASRYKALEQLYREKLWHQVTKELETFIETIEGEALVQLYENFIKSIEKRLNTKQLMQFAVRTSRQLVYADAITFLNQVAEKVAGKDEVVLPVTEMARRHLLENKSEECKANLERAGEILDKRVELDPVMHGNYYRVSAEYHKAKGPAEDYFKNAMLYLACTPLDSLPADEQTGLAFDLSVSALVSSKIFNFGELLQHPILNTLRGTPHEWMAQLIQAFNSGDVTEYERLVARNQERVVAQPALKQNLNNLREKVQICSLVEQLFALPADGRQVSFDAAAARAHVNKPDVEMLAMRALSLGLIRGRIDQVDEKITATWVAPRVLDKHQMGVLAERMILWQHTVEKTLHDLETQTPDLFA